MKIVPVVRKAQLKDIDEDYEDLLYWQSKTPLERLAALTHIRSHSIKPGERLDKTVLIKRKLHP